jgi:hypothetical protein
MFGRIVLGSLLVCGGLLLGVLSAGLYLQSQQREREAVAMYEREGANAQACWVAEIAIAGHRAPAATAFASDCLMPVVTPLWTKPGFVIVTRTLKDSEGITGAKPRTFSVLLDGSRTDRWRIVDVKSSPGELTLDATAVRSTGLEKKQPLTAGSP